MSATTTPPRPTRALVQRLGKDTGQPPTPHQTSALRQRMQQDLQLAGLSQGTQEAYLRVVRQLAAHFKTAPDQLTEAQLREYLLFLKNDKQLAPSSLRVAYTGIKFFYTRTAPRDWQTLKSIRIPKRKTLPDVLSLEEVRRLIQAVHQPHFKAYFWTVYSLSPAEARGLASESGRYRRALRRVVQQLKLRKTIHLHTLRHSYATHLLEAGVNLRLIQQYLGHRSLQTTMVYLHLTSLGQEQAREAIERLMV